MNKVSTPFVLALVSGVTLMASQPLSAALLYDEDVTPDVIFGSGNANGSFTVDRDNGIEVGLRAKLRHNASGNPENTFNSNGDGTYSFDAGIAPTQTFPTAVWSFEWSINSDYNGTASRNLDELTYELGLDSDPSIGTSWSTFDPINDGNPGAGGAVFWDHAIGDNTTGNGGGTSASDATDYATMIGNNNVAQNSWKPHWFIPFNPTVDGQYDFYLAAFDSSGQLARTDISVIVGEGAVVPVPAAVWLFGSGLLGLVGIARRRKA